MIVEGVSIAIMYGRGFLREILYCQACCHPTVIILVIVNIPINNARCTAANNSREIGILIFPIPSWNEGSRVILLCYIDGRGTRTNGKIYLVVYVHQQGRFKVTMTA